jgi:hypothetical protein
MMKRNKKVYITVSLILLLFLIALFFLVFTKIPPKPECAQGIWNNCNFKKPAEEWSVAARRFGGENGVIDLVVAQAHENELTYVPFPFEKKGQIYSYNQTDKVEPYLNRFDKDGLKVILSIQPNRAEVSDLIDILLLRYGHHKSIIGVNVDLEWKSTGNPNHVSNEERDLWLKKIQRYNPKYKLFLTYYKDYTYFPDNKKSVIILFDGEKATQKEILKKYSKLSSYFESVGIYTGYASNIPPTASYDSIMEAAPNTRYILHVVEI